MRSYAAPKESPFPFLDPLGTHLGRRSGASEPHSGPIELQEVEVVHRTVETAKGLRPTPGPATKMPKTSAPH